MNPKLHKISMELIRTDIEFVGKFFLETIEKHQNGIHLFTLFPHISMVVHETFLYLQKAGVAAKANWDPEVIKLVAEGRHSTKPFGNFDEYEKYFTLMIENNNQHWNHHHTGINGAIGRLFQKDFGIYTLDNQPISSTQTVFQQFGLNLDVMPFDIKNRDKVREYSINLANIYFSFFHGFDSGIDWTESTGFSIPGLSRFNSSDCKLEKLLSKKFMKKTSNIALNFGLLQMYLALNYTRYFILPSTPNTNVGVMKYNFLLVYQVLNNINYLNKILYKDKINNESKEFIQKILDRDRRKFFIGSNKRNFRNTLVHYQINKADENFVDFEISYGGLIERYFDGADYFTFDKLVCDEVVRLSRLMDEWYKS